MNLTKLSKKELLEIATKKKIAGRTKMSKHELLAALEPLFESAETNAASSGENLSSKVEEKPVQKIAAKPKKDEYPIPDHYNTDTLKFMPVDPSKEYAYWEISDFTFNKIKEEVKTNAALILKVFMAGAQGVNEVASVSVEKIGNWYFNVYAPDTEMWSELGVVDEKGAFRAILKSNTVKMPADKVSNIVDEETWLTVGGNLEKLYELSGVGERPDMNSRSARRELAQNLMSKLTMTGSSGNLTSKGK